MLTDKQYVWKRYVTGFTDIMVKQLAAHGERGNSWEDEDADWLLGRAREELEELESALKKLDTVFNQEDYRKKVKLVAKECADVANFMMMIVDSTHNF